MNNLLPIMALKEEEAVRTTFISPGKEAGINTVYDPHKDSELYHVFIHSDFPYETEESWEFDNFEQARSFAADHFQMGWEVLCWDGELRRPCTKENCGQGRSGNCKECANGGGCKACGATEELKL